VWQLYVMVNVHHSQAEGLMIFRSHLLWQTGGIPYWSTTTVTALYYTH